MEGALRPLIHRRASDTATLAYNVAESSHATAQHLTIRAADGTPLDGWWLVPANFDGRAVIVCHGVADSAFGALGFALFFLRQGYAVLAPESRGHGESGGLVTYGVLESADMLGWLARLKTAGVTAPFGFGESLGGAILIQSLARGARFRALVAECPYSGFESVADERVARVSGEPVAHLLVSEGLLYARLRYGVDLRAARPDDAIKDAHCPILLIHGTADNETSPANSLRLAGANKLCAQLWLVPGAKHTGAYAADPSVFESRVAAWFNAAPRTCAIESQQ